jgi:site-specific recombinase XerD
MKETTKRSTFAVLFYINKAKRKKNGTCPIMGRITIDTGIAQFSAKEEINPAVWDAKSGRATGKTREALSVNRALDKLEAEINAHYSRMVLEDGYVTAEDVKNAMNGIGRKATYLLELFREHNAEFKQRVGINRTRRTYNLYAGAYKQLAAFVRYKYDMEDIPLRSITHGFIDAFDCYMRVNKGLTATTVLNYVIPLQKIIRRAISQETLRRNPFEGYVPEKSMPKRRHLTIEEFQKLLDTPIPNKSIARTRDMFLFACFTGLSYVDLKRLSTKHIITDPDGRMWIRIDRQKTKSECNIPLLEQAVQIMEKYKAERIDERIFIIRTPKFVRFSLYKVAAVCGLETHLTFHMARHTFGTQVCLSQGIPMETICKMMGHRSIKTTAIYSKITRQKISEDVKQLAGKIDGLYVLPDN